MPTARPFLALSLLLSAGLAFAEDLPSGAVRRFGDSHLRLTDRVPPALSSDGKLVAWKIRKDAVRLTELATGKAVKDATIPADIVADRKFHFTDPAGARLLFIDLEHSHLLDTATGKVAHTFKDQGQAAGDWVLAGNGATAALVPSYDRSPIRFWDLKTGQQLGEYAVVQGQSATLGISADGDTAVVSVDGFKKTADGVQPDKHLEVVEVKTGKVLRRIDTKEWQRTPVVSADGKLVATNPTNGSRTEVRDTATGKVVAEFGETRLGYVGFHQPYRFSKDGTRLALSFTNGSSVMWDLGKKEVVADSKRQSTQVIDVAFTDTNEAVLLGVHLQAMLTWKIDGTPAAPLDTPAGNVTALRFTPDGKHLLTYATDRRVRRWEVGTGKPLGVVHAEEFGPHDYPAASPFGFTGAFSPDGKHLVKVSLANKTEVVDTATGKVVGELKAASEFNPGWVSVVFAPDGGKVFAAGNYYDREANKNNAAGCAWSLPDGKRLADERWKDQKLDACVALAEETFKKKYPADWPTAGKRRVSVAPLPKEDQFSRTGLRVSVFDEGADKPVLETDTRALFTNAVALSPDGTKLAVGWNDTTVLLFDVPAAKK
jgi:WD40 repeat protein